MMSTPNGVFTLMFVHLAYRSNAEESAQFE